jgi:hypothetical protein
MNPMDQFRRYRNAYGNVWIEELVWTHWGRLWRTVAFYQEAR